VSDDCMYDSWLNAWPGGELVGFGADISIPFNVGPVAAQQDIACAPPGSVIAGSASPFQEIVKFGSCDGANNSREWSWQTATLAFAPDWRGFVGWRRNPDGPFAPFTLSDPDDPLSARTWELEPIAFEGVSGYPVEGFRECNGVATLTEILDP
jgi:hypothetical protein